MRRRSIVSISALEKIAASKRAAEKREERKYLIENFSGGEKEQAPEYRVLSVMFNQENRITNIHILKTQYYKTIDKYVTQDYVKYPIYSNWKQKGKDIYKKIVLTNKELENLNYHSDPIIKRLCEEIVSKLPSKEYYPSWYKIRCIKYERDDIIKKYKNELNDFILNANDQNKILNEYINKDSIYIEKLDKKISKLEIKLDSLNDKNLKVKSKLNYKLHKLNEDKEEYQKVIILFKNQKEKNKNFVNIVTRDYNQRIKEKHEQAEILTSQVQPLELNIIEDFIPLKDIGGFEKDIIMGCYVIRNKENNKCYVGHSKDILHRISQHFNGTIPKDGIFAEDYYLSSISNKADIFEIKIIRINSLDQMVEKKKELIDIYDALNNGYNSTNGGY